MQWQRMTDAAPEIWGAPRLDWVQRDNYNWVNYDFNFGMQVSTNVARGYWDWDWYVDVDVNGTNIINNIHMKGYTPYHRIIRHNIYWFTTFNGKYKGGLRVGQWDRTIRFRGTFHDSVGHWGWATYWNVPIPAASGPSGVKLNAWNITSDSATLKGSITYPGNYSAITRWRLEYGVNNYNEHTLNVNSGAWDHTWTISGLASDTKYQYHISVWNTSGYISWSGGVFTTQDDNTIRVIQDGQPVREGRIWIIESDGTKRKVKTIKQI